MSRRDIPRIAPLRYTFSRPVSSPWKPVPTSSRAATRPRVLDTPAVGDVILARIFRIVLLPAPFRPTIPNASPWATEKLTSRRDHNSEARLRCRWNVLDAPAISPSRAFIRSPSTYLLLTY